MPNKHITKYLDDYNKLDNPQFAILLKGKWGSGKTHFINEYKDELDKKKKKYIYVSLYGVTSYDEIETKFLQSSNPELFNKKTIYASKIADAFINNKIKKSFGLIKKSLTSLNAKGRILIFDDLERCSIDIVDLLGYINYFVEHQSYNIILIANEKELKKTKKYKRIKEKLIGKTFEFKSDANSAYRFFIKESKNLAIFEKYQNMILSIFEKSVSFSLRELRNAILDFDRFSEIILAENEKYRSEDFTKNLVKTYFIYYFELRAKESFIIDKDPTKYDIYNNKNVLNIETWKSIILDSNINKEIIHSEFELLFFDISKNDKEILKLADFWDINSENEFNLLKNNVIKKLKNLEYTNIQQFGFVLSIILFYRENSLLEIKDISIKKIINDLFKSKKVNHIDLINNNYDFHQHSAYLGYSYFESFDLGGFLEFFEEIKYKYIIDYFSDNINKSKNFEETISILSMFNRYKIPLLKLYSTKDFVNFIMNISDDKKFKLKDLLVNRYKIALSDFNLKEEKKFLEEVLILLRKSTNDKVILFKLEKILIFPIEELIKKVDIDENN